MTGIAISRVDVTNMLSPATRATSIRIPGSAVIRRYVNRAVLVATITVVAAVAVVRVIVRIAVVMAPAIVPSVVVSICFPVAMIFIPVVTDRDYRRGCPRALIAELMLVAGIERT